MVSLLACTGGGIAANSTSAPEIPNFAGAVKPFLKAHCVSCHGPDKQKGDVRLDTVSSRIASADDAERWQNVLDALNLGEMPPEDEARPPAKELTAAIDALTRGMFEAQVRLGSSGDIVVRRLNRREYKHTLEELLGIPIRTDRLPEDDSFDGFDTVGQAQTMSALHINRYLEVAREALDRTLLMKRLPSQVTRVDGGPKEYRKMEKNLDNLAKKLAGEGKKPAKTDKDRAKVAKSLAQARKDFAMTKQIPGAKTGFILANPWSSSKTAESAGEVTIPGTGWEGTPAAKGRYLARFRAGLTKAAPGETHLLEVHRVDRFGKKALLTDYVATVQITGTVDSPRVYEVPFEVDWLGEGVKQENIAVVVPVEQASATKKLGKKAKSPAKVSLIWVDWVEVEGPLNFGVDGRSKILFRGEAKGSEADDEGYAREIIERFCFDAFRRTRPSSEFVDALHEIYRDERKNGRSFVEAVRESLAVVLSSPGFLYLPAPGDGKGRLNGRELACRLAYLLWGAPPDDKLYASAEAGRLLQSDGLTDEVERMLKDPRSNRFVESFVSQWLDLPWLDMIVVEKEFQFSKGRRDSARKETLVFFEKLIRDDLSARNLIDSEFLMIDDVLADFYGLSVPTGNGFRQVKLAAKSTRGGLLGQSAILTMTSTGRRTSPVERGVFVAEKLRGTPPPPPPPNVPQLEVDGELEMRKMLEQHASTPQCASCHRRIDPLGFALESFDVVGRERKPSKSYPFDTHGSLPDGRKFDGPNGLKSVLMADSERMARGLLKSVLTYAWGRPVGFGDEQEMSQIMSRWAKSDYGMRQLVHLVVQSDTFRSN